MSITINRAPCNKWGQELAALHEDTHRVCESLNGAVLQTRRGFHDGKSYNGGYIHPAPVKQGTFYLYPVEFGEFKISIAPLEQHSLAVMEEVLTKEMLTSYLYEVCAVVIEAATRVYADKVSGSASQVAKDYVREYYRADWGKHWADLHIAALREDMQRAMSFKDKAESLMHHARHEGSKYFEKWGYSEGLLKRARHEINKRGAKVNKLRKEVQELEGAVRHLAKENVHLTEQLRGAGIETHTDYRPEFVRAVNKFIAGQHVSPLRERYKDLIGKPEHVKLEYFTVKHASERFRFRKHIHREWWILDGLQP